MNENLLMLISRLNKEIRGEVAIITNNGNIQVINALVWPVP